MAEEMDARGAAFAQRGSSRYTVEWRGHRYEVRAPTLKLQEQQEESKESNTRKAVRLMIACTYWPPEAPPDEQGKARAGTRMFNDKDMGAILESYGDPESLWVKLLEALGVLQQKARSPNAVEDAKGNSEASPGSSPS